MIKKPEDNIDVLYNIDIGCRLTTVPLLKSSMSATGMVVTPGGSWEGVKFTATGITYHGIVLALKVPRSQLTTM